MHLEFDFRVGFILFLLLVFCGIVAYAYATEVTYPVQIPVTQYLSQQESHYITIYHVDASQTTVAGGTVSFGPWSPDNRPFDVIAFSFPQTAWSTCLTITGAKHGVMYYNITDNQGLHYVGVNPDDTYTLTIQSLNANQPLTVKGTIDVLQTESSTQQVPVTTYETSYQTRTDYPYRSFSTPIILVALLVGIGTAVSALQRRRRMRAL